MGELDLSVGTEWVVPGNPGQVATLTSVDLDLAWVSFRLTSGETTGMPLEEFLEDFVMRQGGLV